MAKEQRVVLCMGNSCKRINKYCKERLEAMKAKGKALDIDTMTCQSKCEKAANVEVNGKLHCFQNPVKLSKLL